MLKNQILSTIKFFDLQDYPLTLLELHRFLISDMQTLRQKIDSQGEVILGDNESEKQVIKTEHLLFCIEQECQDEVQNYLGFYFLSGRKNLVSLRLKNYEYGIYREKLIRRFLGGVRHIPFIRGVALGGSQAMGLQKAVSDIDLLIITEPKYMWLARTLVTAYFQVLGKRRYGKKIANRFCLNHYLAGPKRLDQIRNLYSAMEYGRLRPMVYGDWICEFQSRNAEWIQIFFPNWKPVTKAGEPISKVQRFLERIFTNRFGDWLEQMLKTWQLPRIKKDKFIIVEEDELSFHPNSKQDWLLKGFFKF